MQSFSCIHHVLDVSYGILYVCLFTNDFLFRKHFIVMEEYELLLFLDFDRDEISIFGIRLYRSLHRLFAGVVIFTALPHCCDRHNLQYRHYLNELSLLLVKVHLFSECRAHLWCRTWFEIEWGKL